MSGRKPTIAVTGAAGFVGCRMAERLERCGHPTLRLLRRAGPTSGTIIGDIGPDTHWDGVLEGVSAVVHCAARVHVMNDTAAHPLETFREVNVAGTLGLAAHAAAMGVKRFIFVSSIKVNGEFTTPGQPYTADDVPNPQDPYGISKLEAEESLFELARKTGMEVVIVRPPLVYGAGVRANFLSMMRWLRMGIPLPFGRIDNRRSLVALENLVDLLYICLEHPAAANQRFLVSDGDDLSTAMLLRRLGGALGRPARLLPVPVRWIEHAARIAGREDLSRRLCGSLQVDIGKTRQLLNWTPPVTVDQALTTTARHFLEAKR